MYAYKVMIHPNNKQETKIRRTLNKCIECNNIVYDYINSFIKRNEKIPSCGDVRKWFTIQKSIIDNETREKRKYLTKRQMIISHLDTLFYDVSNDALKQEIKDTYNAFVRYFQKKSEYPVRKDYKRYKKTFYIDPYKILFTNDKVRLEKIANNQKQNRQILNYISLAEKGRIPANVKYYNPRIVLEGNRFYVVVGVDDINAPKKNKIKLSNEVIGIDTNIKALVTSDNDVYKAITLDKKYKKENKRLKRIQRRLSKKELIAKKLNKTLNESKNYQKIKRIKQRYSRKINNLKNAHIDYIITSLINKRPKVIAIEDLDVKNMMKKKTRASKYVSKGIQQNPFRKLLKKLEERCNKNGITIKKADRYYASSKRCNNCGNIKSGLKLSDRVYICDKCGLVINRDYNAAINIKKYALEH